MTTNLPIDYVTKDYDGFLQMMKDAIPTLTPEWTDTSDSDQGIVILQLLAYGLHTLAYYQDRAVTENILQVAQTKKAILRLCSFLGYEIERQKAAKTVIQFEKSDTLLNQDVVIPAKTQISTNPELGEQVIFETDENMIIEAGQLTGEVSATQGESVLREILGVGTNNPDQQYKLDYPDVIEEDLIVVTEENGQEYVWSKVKNFIDSTPTDRHYITSSDEEEQTIVTFGNGIFGMKPPLDANVFASYRHGGGTIGNMAVGLITYLNDTVIEGIVSVTNTIEATGGKDYEDIERARELAPKAYRSGGKAVTPQDFQDIAENISGVSKALCEETFNIDNDVNLYIATEDFNPASEELLALVKKTLDEVRVMNNNLLVLPCLYKEFDVDVTVYIQENFVAKDVEVEVIDLIRQELQPSNFKLGDSVYLSKVIQKGFFAAGVRNVVVNAPTEDVTCAFNEFPKFRNIQVTVVGGL